MHTRLVAPSPKRRRFLMPFSFSSFFFLLAATVTLSFFTLTNHRHPHPPSHLHLHLHKRLQTQTAHLQCAGALYHQLCVSTLSKILPRLPSQSLPDVISATLNQTISDVRSTDFNVTSIRRKLPHLTLLEIRALEDCHTLFLQTLSDLKSAVSDLTKSPSGKYNDLQTLLSAAMTNQATCLDGFQGSKSQVKISRHFRKALKGISRQVSNSLALLKKLNSTTGGKSETFPEYGKVAGGFPEWVKRSDRRLLQTATNETKYDVVVAQDGSGNFTTIGEALNVAPNSSSTRFVIYIKAGAYYEYVEVTNKKRMVMFLGDGIGKTLIKGNRNVVDGWTTFRSATVSK